MGMSHGIKIVMGLVLFSLVWLCAMVILPFGRNDYTTVAVAKNSDEYQLASSMVSGGKIVGDDDDDGDGCLSFDDDVDRLIQNAEQIYITMPDKCAGSSMKDFLSVCEKNHVDGLLRGKFEDNILADSMEMPTMIADHAEEDWQIIHTIDNASSDALIIFIYRDEPGREASAIKHVVLSRICSDMYDGPPPEPRVPYHAHGKKCVIEDEKIFIDSIIKPRYWEIGFGIYDVLTCATHEAIEKEGPNMIMVHIGQVERLQILLAKHRCPRHAKTTFRTNTAGEKPWEGFIRLDKGDDEVPLDDWVESKKGQFGMLQPFNDGYKPSCKGKTRKLENAIQSCEDSVIWVSGQK